MAHQLSVFAENKPGRIERVTQVLADAGVNIRAITIASGGDFGVIKLLVDDPQKGYKNLKDAGIPVALKEIVAVYMDDRPGGLLTIAKIISAREINVEDAYGFVVQDKKRAVFVIQVEKIPKTVAILSAEGFEILSDQEIYSL